jgi:hypothetical protein
MAANPEFRVIVGVGYHDAMTTVGASEYAVAQAGWPKERSVFPVRRRSYGLLDRKEPESPDERCPGPSSWGNSPVG